MDTHGNFIFIMSHFTSTKPFFILQGVPNVYGFTYGANPIGDEVNCNPAYIFTEYDTEQEVADAVDALKGEVGWYWECDNRIPYPPNPNEWSYQECITTPPPEDPS